MSEEVICSGCGISIQTENKNELGYVPSQALEREVVICQRCFRLKHYNEVPDLPLTSEDFIAILNRISKEDALVVKIVDIFDFTGSWLDDLASYVGRKDVMLVGNKSDLLPESVNQNKVMLWMREEAKKRGVIPKDVRLMSASKGHDVEKVAHAMDKARKGRDVYIVGATNVGKSTFINTLIQLFGGDEEQLLTTSHFPGTTLDMLDLPLDDGSKLYDTPGIINEEQITHVLDKNELKDITPTKEIKPAVYQLHSEQTLFFAGLARLDFLEGERNSFICYLSNSLYIHRTKSEQADALYEKHKGEMLSPPYKDTIEALPPFVRHEFFIEEEKTDIVIPGLGWVTVRESGAHVCVFAPEGVKVSLREAII
ncbi:ribosome biogenesis GTPase YqeH [Salsuginibacillus kocurii]|uniref:ribosome biogenesis GTPase YqeH n=1 Tax=Salsuginibacillus kocurii TaxID=427078 RepID=UPI000361395E|nr:ribosome biogenesis GTPase YqeH [Salsuginibacillus kocurii]